MRDQVGSGIFESLKAQPFFSRLNKSSIHWVRALLVLTVLAGSSASFAKESHEARLAKIRAQIKLTTQQIESSIEKRSLFEKQLRNIEKKIQTTDANIRNKSQSIKKTNQQLQTLELKKRKLSNEQAQQKKQIKKQIYNAYVQGNNSTLPLLLNQKEPNKISRAYHYYRYINDARMRHIQDAQNTITQLESVKTDISTRKATLETLKATLNKNKNTLLTQRAQRAKLIAKINARVKNKGQELKKLKQNERNLKRLIASLNKLMADIPPDSQVAFSTLKGKLNKPIKGRTLNSFGSQRQGSDLKWSGIMIRTSIGQSVKVIAGGRVVFADHLRGFGLLTIVDHGKGYLSLYGHNQNLTRSVGDWVSKEDIIAHAGDSGGIANPALYFELRYKGKPINPNPWFRR